tara:strand:+ start:1149 stop:1295 length:147 start_codon:yes stop_codon:yes gene_type:complete
MENEYTNLDDATKQRHSYYTKGKALFRQMILAIQKAGINFTKKFIFFI